MSVGGILLANLASKKEQSEESRDGDFRRPGQWSVLGGGSLMGPYTVGVADREGHGALIPSLQMR